jgi:hypothetical protein
MRYIILLSCMCICCFTNAQKKVRYTGSIESGILKGDRPASTFVYTTHGVAYKQYAFSLGSGYDFYPLRSLPLFIDVKRRFNGNQIQPFIQAAAGVNFTSPNSSDAKSYSRYAGDGNFSNGFFAKGGGGFIFRAQKQWNFSLSAGYTYKTTSYIYTPFTGTPWVWQLQPVKDIYHFNRWYVSVGILW